MNERWTQLLISQGAQFADGRVIAYADADATATLHAPETALCDLSHYGVLQISGDDAAAFMQGQFTNDVAALADGQAQWNGWCSPKGRLLVTFLLWREQAIYYLLMPQTLMPAIQKKLSMYVLRAKVRLADVSDTMPRMGVVGAPANLGGAWPPAKMSGAVIDHVRVIRLANERFLIVAETNAALGRWNELAQSCIKAPAARWDLAGIREGVIEVTRETQDAFVPQMANFELIGGVNFKKGCYTGQEIVARTQYRGILKRRMVRVSFTADHTPPPGTPVYSPTFAGQACGTIALAAAVDNTVEALVVAQIDSMAGGGLFLDAAFMRPLAILDLPYAVS